MTKRYSVFAKAYKTGIIIGFRTIEDVRPEALRKDVEELLAMDGLGPDCKPLKVEEPKEDGNTSEAKEGAPKENESEEESPNKEEDEKEVKEAK
ncbi:Uncharacterised protein [Anaerococcus prevotii]|uniref:Uncharacterized protein n=1 Tax=Anaerococcus prevotii (strain ATCC 9321 / DSM 20548 / JCM 6508 / NCTC 11806 / PC1) TaxID=525919 RepID=C7RHC8_ANAPD|nr:hypothetical protein [Anaerococcus prevotii]ACV28889.1 hypothetical protein Apre_0861 [Anaerococcus prevotii DSM 20548]SUU94562.1 Uncharacterised protein [Anaerococcus prevotii]